MLGCMCVSPLLYTGCRTEMIGTYDQIRSGGEVEVSGRCVVLSHGVSADSEILLNWRERSIRPETGPKVCVEVIVRWGLVAIDGESCSHLGDDADRLHSRHRTNRALWLVPFADTISTLQTEEVVSAWNQRPGNLLIAANDTFSLARS